ncbi:hypothetical protein [Paenibacillus sp. 32352]|uniref:hypothetical protein n=1 Tax=Paenibacillus sp. 32352 TaxID=1969111 RepID=UPI0009AE149B|nr:hypothetical protein [Paenibacillus sp. 32352]
MKIIKLLADMETSRFGSFMLGTRRSNYKWIGLGMLVLLAVSIVLMRGFTTVNGLLSTAVLNVFTVMIFFVLIDGIHLSTKQERAWWLLLPHPRLTLVLGKALALWRIGMQLFLYFVLIRMAQYALLLGLHQIEAAAWTDVLLTLGAGALLLIAALPVIVSLGILVSVFPLWWVRSLVILVMMYLFTPSLIFTFMAGDTGFASTTLTPLSVSRFAGIALLIGWPFSILCLGFTATVGMRYLVKASSWTGSAAVRRHHERQAALPVIRSGPSVSRKSNPFWSLVAMERRRYLWFGLQNHRQGKIIAGVLMMVIAFIAYQNAGEVFELVSFFSLVFIGFYMFTIIYYFNRQTEFMKGTASWWVAMPHSRRLLLGSRAMAYLSVVLPYLAVLLLSTVIGTAVRQWIDPMPKEELKVALSYFSHYALVFIPLIILYIIALQGFPAFLKRSWQMIFTAPLYGGYILSFQLANAVIMPHRLDGATFRSGPAPDFGYHLLLIYGAAVPYALFCFWLGCKYMNRYALARDTIWLGKLNK